MPTILEEIAGESQLQQEANILGEFMYETTGLDKELMGYFFGQDEPLNKMSFTRFLRCFNFKRLPIDTCWRLLVNKTGLPKEGQQICRLIDLFQDVYLEHNAGVEDQAHWDKDTVWTLSVKLLDLNTNLHNPNVKPMLRYSRETFVDQSITLLKDAFSREQLSDMYDRILNQKFE